MRDFRHSLPMLLLRAREAVMEYFRPVLSGHGLTEQQWRILRALAEEDDLETGALAERVLVLPPSLTGILDRMERAALVRRHRQAQDRRRIRVRRTARGRRLYERIVPLVEAQYRELEQRLPTSARTRLEEVLQTLIELQPQAPSLNPEVERALGGSAGVARAEPRASR